MHDEPRSDATDPESPTERLDPIGASDPAPLGATARLDPSRGEPEAPTDRFAPAPEPRADWAGGWDPPVPPTPERWYEPAPTIAARSGHDRGSTRVRRAGRSSPSALLSAVLASGGTVLALGAAGVLDRPVVGPAAAQGTNVGAPQPVTIDESSATINVAAKVSPAVVRITVAGFVRRRQSRGHPGDRRRIGRHL